MRIKGEIDWSMKVTRKPSDKRHEINYVWEIETCGTDTSYNGL